MSRRIALAVIVLFALAVLPDVATAQTYFGPPGAAAAGGALPQLGQPLPGQAPTGLPNTGQLFTGLADTANTVRTYIAGFATTLFFGLVTLDIAWTIVQALMSGRADTGELLVSLTQKTITFSLVYWIFVVNGFGIVSAIIGSFVSLGTGTLSTIASGAPTDPLGLIQQGFTNAAPSIAEVIAFGLVPDEFFATGFSNLLTGVIDLQVLTAAITVGAYAFLAGTLALAIVEAYIVTAAGIIVTGFLGSRWTVGIGEKYFSYAVSVGVKLLMVYVCIGVIYPLNSMIQEFNAIPLVGGFVALVAAVVAYSAPQFAASIISGSSNSSFGQFAGQFAGLAGGGLKALSGAVSGAGTAGALAGSGGGAEGGGGAAARGSSVDSAATARDTGVEVHPPAETQLGAERFAADGGDGDRGNAATPSAVRRASTPPPFSGIASPAPARAESLPDTDAAPLQLAQASNGTTPDRAPAANPYEMTPQAYRSLGAAELRSSLNPEAIPKMTREQLRGAMANPGFGSLPMRTRLDTASALSDKSPVMQSLQSSLAAAGAFTDRIGSTIPLEDHGSTGAVSIRVNV